MTALDELGLSVEVISEQQAGAVRSRRRGDLHWLDGPDPRCPGPDSGGERRVLRPHGRGREVGRERVPEHRPRTAYRTVTDTPDEVDPAPDLIV